MTEPEITTTLIGGNCPVQAEGTINGHEFYFRARGDSWSLSVGGPDVVGHPVWYYEQPYGEWPDAGWMSVDEARAFILKGAKILNPPMLEASPDVPDT